MGPVGHTTGQETRFCIESEGQMREYFELFSKHLKHFTSLEMLDYRLHFIPKCTHSSNTMLILKSCVTHGNLVKSLPGVPSPHSWSVRFGQRWQSDTRYLCLLNKNNKIKYKGVDGCIQGYILNSFRVYLKILINKNESYIVKVFLFFLEYDLYQHPYQFSYLVLTYWSRYHVPSN